MNRSNEGLYFDAVQGDKDAWDVLLAEARSGDADAQYFVYCMFNNPNSPLHDEGLAIYWLNKSSERGSELSKKKIQSLTRDQKLKYGLLIETSEEDKVNYEDIEPGGIWSSRGRIDRTTFLVYLIVYSFIGALANFLINLIPLETVSINGITQLHPTMFAVIASLVVAIVFGYLMIMLIVKRLHDCGRSAAWAILAVIPFAPLVLLFVKGENKTNQYGPKPE